MNVKSDVSNIKRTMRTCIWSNLFILTVTIIAKANGTSGQVTIVKGGSVPMINSSLSCSQIDGNLNCNCKGGKEFHHVLVPEGVTQLKISHCQTIIVAENSFNQAATLKTLEFEYIKEMVVELQGFNRDMSGVNTQTLSLQIAHVESLSFHAESCRGYFDALTIQNSTIEPLYGKTFNSIEAESLLWAGNVIRSLATDSITPNVIATTINITNNHILAAQTNSLAFKFREKAFITGNRFEKMDPGIFKSIWASQRKTTARFLFNDNQIEYGPKILEFDRHLVPEKSRSCGDIDLRKRAILELGNIKLDIDCDARQIRHAGQCTPSWILSGSDSGSEGSDGCNWNLSITREIAESLMCRDSDNKFRPLKGNEEEDSKCDKKDFCGTTSCSCNGRELVCSCPSDELEDGQLSSVRFDHHGSYSILPGMTKLTVDATYCQFVSFDMAYLDTLTMIDIQNANELSLIGNEAYSTAGSPRQISIENSNLHLLGPGLFLGNDEGIGAVFSLVSLRNCKIDGIDSRAFHRAHIDELSLFNITITGNVSTLAWSAVEIRKFTLHQSNFSRIHQDSIEAMVTDFADISSNTFDYIEGRAFEKITLDPDNEEAHLELKNNIIKRYGDCSLLFDQDVMKSDRLSFQGNKLEAECNCNMYRMWEDEVSHTNRSNPMFAEITCLSDSEMIQWKSYDVLKCEHHTDHDHSHFIEDVIPKSSKDISLFVGGALLATVFCFVPCTVIIIVIVRRCTPRTFPNLPIGEDNDYENTVDATDDWSSISYTSSMRKQGPKRQTSFQDPIAEEAMYCRISFGGPSPASDPGKEQFPYPEVIANVQDLDDRSYVRASTDQIEQANVETVRSFQDLPGHLSIPKMAYKGYENVDV